ncbi:NAD(P)-binding protein [Sporormia fimetaria CBS 119925]|uniref:NAD(P)-binding protein n=1 Tax=Sporormia fimetaria CBS 119925 TaxID=1340428 RepID=A0A6A6UZV5_9PLEO|nr:NAD(P)-binding protein [Sporormia fimetaria CBS 119925]
MRESFNSKPNKHKLVSSPSTTLIMTRIFLTGAVDYIGGSVFHTIIRRRSDWKVTVLLPGPDLPIRWANTYRSTRLKVVEGHFGSSAVLTQCASDADIVIHCGPPDHVESLKAIIKGLLLRTSRTAPFLIHLSDNLVWDRYSEAGLGTLNNKVWSDVEDAKDIFAQPAFKRCRATEEILFDTINKHGDKVNIAMVFVPAVYGIGLGLGAQGSPSTLALIEECLRLGCAFYYGHGANSRSWVHIKDLVKFFLQLVEAAAFCPSEVDWGKEGIYFASTQEYFQFQIAGAFGSILQAHGLIDNPQPVPVDLFTLDQLVPHFHHIPGAARYIFAMNSRTRPDRAMKRFGYRPQAPTLMETVGDKISFYLRSLGTDPNACLLQQKLWLEKLKQEELKREPLKQVVKQEATQEEDMQQETMW